MKTTLHRHLLAAFVVACTSLAQAQNSMVPSAMSYQGMLTDDQGNAVAPSAPENRNVEFRIYDVAAGGTPLWGEAQTVTVFKGSFSVILGNGTAVGAPSGPAAFAAVFTNASSADLYFGITPQGGAEFAPRQKLLSSAFALRAKTAETVNASAQANGVPSQFNWVAANNLTVNGHAKINGHNVLEFGVNDASITKTAASGMIAYQAYTSGLDIVGAGVSDSERRITMWAEAGTQFQGPIHFPGRFGQHINLNDASNGLGVQNDGIYLRTYDKVAFFRQGVHNDGTENPGAGGSLMALLSPAGFTLNSGKFTGDGSGLTNVPIPSTVNNLTLNGIINKNSHGVFIGSFGSGHSFGSQDWTTYSRSARNFAWYLDGAHVDTELSAGGGTRIMTLTGGGLTLNQGGLAMETGSINFGNRLGQHINLWGTDFGIGLQNSATYFRTSASGSFNWYAGGTHANDGAGGGVNTASWDANRFDFYRRVYIGSNGTGTLAPLEISGQTGAVGVGNVAVFYLNGTNAVAQYGTGTAAALSIRATGQILGSSFIATSDLRMKLPEGRSDSAKDLQTLNALEITDYTMKDRLADGGRKHKKLIAQQVEQVFPQAVAKATGTVPDIYRAATVKGGLIVLKNSDGVELKKGDTVRLLQATRDLTTEVTEVKKQGFTVKDMVENGELFVYGRKVDDLRTVDYESVAMLNVSATQELARQIAAQKATLEKVQKERDALAAEVTALRQSTSAQSKRLAAIEARLEGATPKPVMPTALQVNLRRQ